MYEPGPWGGSSSARAAANGSPGHDTVCRGRDRQQRVGASSERAGEQAGGHLHEPQPACLVVLGADQRRRSLQAAAAAQQAAPPPLALAGDAGCATDKQGGLVCWTASSSSSAGQLRAVAVGVRVAVAVAVPASLHLLDADHSIEHRSLVDVSQGWAGGEVGGGKQLLQRPHRRPAAACGASPNLAPPQPAHPGPPCGGRANGRASEHCRRCTTPR